MVPALEKMLPLPKLIKKAQTDVEEATSKDALLQKQSLDLNESKVVMELKKQQCDGE